LLPLPAAVTDNGEPGRKDGAGITFSGYSVGLKQLGSHLGQTETAAVEAEGSPRICTDKSDDLVCSVTFPVHICAFRAVGKVELQSHKCYHLRIGEGGPRAIKDAFNFTA
jgi:hypothetical protein